MGLDPAVRQTSQEFMCKAGGVTNFAKIGHITSHPNYGRPCVPVAGKYDGKPCFTCVFCGRTMPSGRSLKWDTAEGV